MNKDWIKVENFISEDISTLLYGYVLLAHKRLSVTRDNRYGTFGDSQNKSDFSMYGDLIFDTLLVIAKTKLVKFSLPLNIKNKKMIDIRKANK